MPFLWFNLSGVVTLLVTSWSDVAQVGAQCQDHPGSTGSRRQVPCSGLSGPLPVICTSGPRSGLVSLAGVA